jgi:hypothetical protein
MVENIELSFTVSRISSPFLNPRLSASFDATLAMATIPLLAPLCGVPKKTRPVLEQS